MVTREVAEWEVVDASNDFTAEEGGWTEGMARSAVNNAARADMGALRRFYEDTEWLDLTVGSSVTRISSSVLRVLSNPGVAYFVPGRRLKMTGGSIDPFYATVVSAVSLGGDIDVTVDAPSDSGGIPTGPPPTAVFLHSTPTVGPFTWYSAFIRTVPILTDVGLQEAFDSGIGTIYLEPGAVYVINATVTINNTSTRVIGNGSILRAGTNLDAPIMEIIGSNAILDSVIFDGQESVQGAGSDDKGLLKINTVAVSIENCGFNDSWGHGIEMVTGVSDILVLACVFSNIGQDGINMDDSNTFTERVYIDDCSFSSFSERLTGGAGIRLAGRVCISNCQFSGMDDASFIQTGIIAVEKAVGSPDDQSGHDSSITGCYFKGTGLNCNGVLLNGRDVVVSGCNFDLNGASAKGVEIFQPLIADIAERNRVVGCSFKNSSIGVNILSDAQNTAVTGCNFDQCVIGILVDGDKCAITGNVIINGTTGINVSSSCDSALVADNSITSMSGNGITVSGGAMNCAVAHNLFSVITGLRVSDGGTNTTIRYLDPVAYTQKPLTLPTITPGATNFTYVNFLLPVPSTANGIRTFIADVVITFSSTQVSTPVTFELFTGTGSGAGPPITGVSWLRQIDTATATINTPKTMTISGLRVIPQAGDDLYLGIRATAGHIITIYGDDDANNFRSWYRLTGGNS